MKKSNTLWYLLLLGFSVLFLGHSLLFPSSDKWFTILSSVGCSGIVSVVVAWLIERANEHIQNNQNKELVEIFLESFDINISAEMQRALSRCARKSSFVLEKAYTIAEIHELLKDDAIGRDYFKGMAYMQTKYMQNGLSMSILSFDRSDTGIKLYTQINLFRDHIDTMKSFEKLGVEPTLYCILGDQVFSALEQIYAIRGKTPTFELHKDTQKYLNSVRNAAKKEVQG